MNDGECTVEGEETTFVSGCGEVKKVASEDFWEPPDEVEDLYNLFWQRKYREIPRKFIE